MGCMPGQSHALSLSITNLQALDAQRVPQASLILKSFIFQLLCKKPQEPEYSYPLRVSHLPWIHVLHKSGNRCTAAPLTHKTTCRYILCYAALCCATINLVGKISAFETRRSAIWNTMELNERTDFTRYRQLSDRFAFEDTRDRLLVLLCRSTDSS